MQCVSSILETCPKIKCLEGSIPQGSRAIEIQRKKQKRDRQRMRTYFVCRGQNSGCLYEKLINRARYQIALIVVLIAR